MPVLQKNLEKIDLKIETSTQDYKHLKDLYLESAAQVDSMPGETRVLHQSSVPKEPVQPIKIYHVGLTAFLSLFVSTGLVFIFDFFNIDFFKQI